MQTMAVGGEDASPAKKKGKADSRKDSVVDNSKAYKAGLAHLSEQEVEGLENYGLYRPDETSTERAGKNIPSKAELTLMLIKAYMDADAEQKAQSKQKAAAKRVSVKNRKKSTEKEKEKSTEREKEKDGSQPMTEETKKEKEN